MPWLIKTESAFVEVQVNFEDSPFLIERGSASRITVGKGKISIKNPKFLMTRVCRRPIKTKYLFGVVKVSSLLFSSTI